MRYPTIPRTAVGLWAALVAAGCSGTPGAVATDAGHPADAANPVDFGDAGHVAEIDPDRMMHDVQVLASDDYGGRLPGTAGGALALDYVESTFSGLGLTPAGDGDGYRQQFSFGQWQQDAPSVVALGGSGLTEGADYALLENSGSGEVSGEMVFVGYGLTVPPYSRDDYPDCPIAETGYDDYAGVDLTGKVALVLRHGPNDTQAIHDYCPASSGSLLPPPTLWQFGYKAANARQHGAVAILLVPDYRHDVAPFEGSISIANYEADFPALSVGRNLIEARVPSLHSWADAIDSAISPDPHATGVTADITTYTSRSNQDTDNLLAVIPGTDPELGDQVVLIGAHLDHLGTDPNTHEIYHGADDNASGTAVLMELARVAVEVGLQPARTVIFAAFNAEEEGLYGSCYTEQHLDFPVEEIVAMISVDMVGAGNGTGLDLFGTADQQNGWLAQLMSAAGAEADLPYTPSVAAALLASDHACFAYAGVTAVLASTSTVDDHLYYHTPQDTYDTILPQNLDAAASLTWVTLRALAMGEEQDYLSRARPLGSLRRAAIDPRRRDRRF